MATIYLTLSTKMDENNQSEILIRFSHGKINQRAKTNIFVKSKYWNEKKQYITIPNTRIESKEKKAIKDELTEKDKKLNNLKSHILLKFTEADKNDFQSDWLKDLIDKHNFPEKYEVKPATPQIQTLFQFSKHFVETAKERKDKETGRTLSKRTITRYGSIENQLKDFAQSIGKKDFTFDEIDQNFYDRLIDFLQVKDRSNGHEEEDLKGYSLNYVGSIIKGLKVMLNDATAQGFNSNLKFRTFHIFVEDIDNIYLTEEELQLIKDAKLSQKYLEHVRDWFLLLAWTGSRFSDLSKITESDIKDGFITFRQQKTNNKVTIPLHPVVLEIFEKYNYQMPKPISNQRFNEYIKTVCKEAKIKTTETTTKTIGGKLVTEKFEKWEHVSSHTGRRSFCTNMYKRGLPTLMIMSISGHTTEKSFLKYIKISQEEHAEMMKKEWAKIYTL